MIGSTYFMYSPKLIFEMTTGLRIYESVFSSPDGSCGVVGGPHPKFTEIENKWSEVNLNFRKFRDKKTKSFKRYELQSIHRFASVEH